MSRDHRASFRFTLPEGQDRGLLRVGWQNLAVQILNVSSTGFLLACPQIEVRKGQLLWLRTATAWTRIRVVFLKDSGAETHVGVERLDELEETPELTSGWSPFSLLGPAQYTAGGLGSLAIAVCVLAGIIAGTLLINHEWGGSRSASPSRHLSQSISGFEHDLERAWSKVWTAANRIIPRFRRSNPQDNRPMPNVVTTDQPPPKQTASKTAAAKNDNLPRPRLTPSLQKK
jgi:hypothetical protein